MNGCFRAFLFLFQVSHNSCPEFRTFWRTDIFCVFLHFSGFSALSFEIFVVSLHRIKVQTLLMLRRLVPGGRTESAGPESKKGSCELLRVIRWMANVERSNPTRVDRRIENRTWAAADVCGNDLQFGSSFSFDEYSQHIQPSGLLRVERNMNEEKKKDTEIGKKRKISREKFCSIR